MKSLWVTSWYPNKYSPFNGDFIQRMAHATSPFCSLAVLSVVEGDVNQMEVEIRSETFLELIVYIPSFPTSGKSSFTVQLARGMNYLKAYRKGMRLLYEHFGKPDILHLHVIFPAGLFASLYHLWSGIPFIISEHWSGFRKANWARLRWYHRWPALLCAKLARFILPVSPALVADMQALGLRGRYAVVPNVVDINLFKPLVKRFEKPIFRFLHISNLLDKAKNISGILEVARQLEKERQDFEIYLIGDGVDREKLEKKVEDYNLKQRVAFIGEVQHEAVSLHMQEGNALLMFSNYENLPCVILEALTIGLPVIATETGGIKEWVKPGKGYLVQPGDEEGLINAMRNMIDLRKDFDPEFVRSEVADQCSYSAVGRKIVSYYHQILSRP